MRRQLLFNSASGAVVNVLHIAIAFFLSPIIVRSLGNRDYGIWEMLMSFVGYFGILELGVGPALIRYVAREEALGNKEQLSRIFNTAFCSLLLAGVAILAAMSILSMWPETVLGLKPGEVDELPLLFIVAGCSMLVQFLGTLFVAFLMGKQKHLTVNVTRSILGPAQALVIVVALTTWEGPALMHLALISLAGNVLQYSLFAAFAFRSLGESLNPRSFSLTTAKELYRFGLKSVVLMAANRIQKGSLPLVIGHVVGASSVVFFAMPRRLVDYMQNFVISMGIPLMPYLSSVDAQRRDGERMQQWFPLSRAISFISLPAAVMVLALGEPFLHIWLGAEYAKQGRSVIVALCVSSMITGLFSNANRVLVAGNRHGPPAKRVLVISLFSLAAAIPAASLVGITGAAVVLAASDMAANAVMWRDASRFIGIGLPEHLRVTALPLVLPVLAMAACLVCGRLLLSISEYSDLLLIAVVSGITYLVISWRLVLTGQERSALLTRAAGVFARSRL